MSVVLWQLGGVWSVRLASSGSCTCSRHQRYHVVFVSWLILEKDKTGDFMVLNNGFLGVGAWRRAWLEVCSLAKINRNLRPTFFELGPFKMPAQIDFPPARPLDLVPRGGRECKQNVSPNVYTKSRIRKKIRWKYDRMRTKKMVALDASMFLISSSFSE